MIGPPARRRRRNAADDDAPGWRASIERAGVSITASRGSRTLRRAVAQRDPSVSGPSDYLPALACPAGDWPDDVPTDADVRGRPWRGRRLAGGALRRWPRRSHTWHGTVVLSAGEVRQWARASTGRRRSAGVSPERVRDRSATPARADRCGERGSASTHQRPHAHGAKPRALAARGASASIDGVIAPSAAADPARGRRDARRTSAAHRRDEHRPLGDRRLSRREREPHAPLRERRRCRCAGARARRHRRRRRQIAITDSAILDTHDALFGGVTAPSTRGDRARRLGRARAAGHETSDSPTCAHATSTAMPASSACSAPICGASRSRRSTGRPRPAIAVSPRRPQVHLDGNDVALVHGADVVSGPIGDADAVVLVTWRSSTSRVGSISGRRRDGASDVRIDSHRAARADPGVRPRRERRRRRTLALDRAQLTPQGSGPARRAARAVARRRRRATSSPRRHQAWWRSARGAGFAPSSVRHPRERKAIGALRSDLSVDGVAFADGVDAGLGVGARQHDRSDAPALLALARKNGVLRGAGIASVGSSAVVRTSERRWGDGLVCGSSGRMSLDAIDVRSAERAGLVVSFDCAPSRWTGTITGCAIGVLTDEHPAAATDFSGIVLSDDGVSYIRSRSRFRSSIPSF